MADRLRRAADEYRALREEHCVGGDFGVVLYMACEVALRELAYAIETERSEAT